MPVVATDGSIYVSFFSLADMVIYRDNMLVVKVHPITGQRVAGPFHAVWMIDGITDYPISRSNRQTLQDGTCSVALILFAAGGDAILITVAWLLFFSDVLDPFNEHSFLDIRIVLRFTSITWFKQGSLPLQESASLYIGSLSGVEDVVLPMEISIRPISVIDAFTVNEEAHRVIGLFAGKYKISRSEFIPVHHLCRAGLHNNLTPFKILLPRR